MLSRQALRMSIRFFCTHCGELHVEGDDSVGGTEVTCTACGRSFVAPKPTAIPTGFPPRRFGTLVFLAWGLLTFYPAYYASHYLFLIHLYGFSRVRAEHLHFTEMPKGRPWVVSNGDVITEGYFVHFLIGVGLWFALFFITFRFIYHLLPERKIANAAT
jgi:hypothetical protein